MTFIIACKMSCVGLCINIKLSKLMAVQMHISQKYSGLKDMTKHLHFLFYCCSDLLIAIWNSD